MHAFKFCFLKLRPAKAQLVLFETVHKNSKQKTVNAAICLVSFFRKKKVGHFST